MRGNRRDELTLSIRRDMVTNLREAREHVEERGGTVVRVDVVHTCVAIRRLQPGSYISQEAARVVARRCADVTLWFATGAARQCTQSLRIT